MTHPNRHHACRAVLAALILPACCLLTLAVPVVAEAKSTKALPTLRVMLNPATAPRGTLPDAARDRLAALADSAVVLVGTTRTGALELAVVPPPGTL